MSLQPYLRRRTRDPEFLWKVVIGILVVGALAAYVVQAFHTPVAADESPQEWVDEGEPYVEHLHQLALERRWGELWWALPRYMWQGVSPAPTAMALLAGACWFTFLLQAGQTHRTGGIRWPLAAIGVVLGVVSIWPTLFFAWWQEIGWPLEESDELVAGLRYYIVGVGLREELSKLLLFLPLVPWIVWRRSEREALFVAACVGLGFAIEENIDYIGGMGASASVRFLTANFMHLSLTGLVGLALCRGIWNPRERSGEAVAYFLLAVVMHGLYDAFIALPALTQYALFSDLMFILLAYKFFHELRTWWREPGETVSLTATFLFSNALIVAATLVYLAWQANLELALVGGLAPLLGLGITIYMFLREVPESIIDV